MAESDSPAWRQRIHIFGLDFRDLAGLECFCAFVSVRVFQCACGVSRVVVLGMIPVGVGWGITCCALARSVCRMNMANVCVLLFDLSRSTHPLTH